MKNLILVVVAISLVAHQNSYAQIEAYHTIPCEKVTPHNVAFLNDTTKSTSCVESNGIDFDVDFDAGRNYTITAGEYIEFNESTVIEPNVGKTVDTYIQNDGMNIAWYAPYTTPGSVGRYEKLEIGVQFENAINEQIQNFVNDSLGDKLNPFNPDEVDVYADFSRYSATGLVSTQRVNGFYYEQYARDIANNDWDTLTTEHNFRIRFAPKEIGTYRCRVSAEIDGHGVMDAYEFTFSCVPSSNPGFMRVGDNKRYFRLGEEPFYPIAQNIVGPNGIGGTQEWEAVPVAVNRYTEYETLLEQYAATGGNYYRYIVSPWQSDIEFEHLGNYSKRMTNAWEFDNIINKSKELGLYMHYNMAIHYSFEITNGYAMTFWDWSAKGDPKNIHPNECFRENDIGYCYRNELDMLDPVEFLTDSTARVFYKRRLRYMVSRWGYSTNIGSMELMSEINNFGNQHELAFVVPGDPSSGCDGSPDSTAHFSPYRNPVEPDGSYYRMDLFNWQHEMMAYIRDDLDHKQHPFTACYTGGPASDDPIYESGYVDIPSYNYYRKSVDNFEKNRNDIATYHHPDSGQYINKPFIHSEYGPGDEYTDCDDGTYYIRTANLTPFTGLAASGISWHFQWNVGGYWSYLRPIRTLMKDIPLDEENWYSAPPIVGDDKSYEVLYLQRPKIDNKRKCVGVISNRSYNVYTNNNGVFGTDCSNISVEIQDNDAYEFLNPLVYDDLDHDIKLPDMGGTKKYKIQWYNAITGNFVATQIQWSNAFGKLDLRFPDTLTGDLTAPMLFFKIYPSAESFLPSTVEGNDNAAASEAEIDNGIVETDWSKLKEKAALQKFNYTISPNPSNDFIVIEFEGQPSETVNWTIIDLQGTILKTGVTKSVRFQIDLTGLSAGNYYISIQSGKTIKNSKLIKL